MPILPEVPLLDYALLESFLTRRFEAQSEKLSDIPHPSLLKDALKGSKRLAVAIRKGEKIA